MSSDDLNNEKEYLEELNEIQEHERKEFEVLKEYKFPEKKKNLGKSFTLPNVDEGHEKEYSKALNDIQEEEKEESQVLQEYEFTKEEKEELCRAFTLLDCDGDGVIDPEYLKQLLISWGRMPVNEELDDIMSYANGIGCEGAKGMDFESFRNYIAKQLNNTNDEKELRNAFQVFDSSPSTGKINLTKLRHYLKHKGLKLTDDEIDFLYKEEDYWMLEEKNVFDYEQLIDKILNKPTCKSPFLNCYQ